MQFMLMIYGEDGAFERLGEAARAEVMAGHSALQEALAKRGAYATAKLMAAATAVTLSKAEQGAKPIVLDGPFSETKERFLGFYLAEFANLEEAIEFAGHISSAYVRIELRAAEWAGGVLAREGG